MKKWLLAALAVGFGLIVIVSSIQAYRYFTLIREVRALEKQQEELVERNKQLITGIAVLKSPFRIDELAKTILELSRTRSSLLVGEGE